MRSTQTLFIIFLMVAYNMVMAGTIETNSQEPFEQCGYCHEYDGNSVMPDYPKLAGQDKNYLVKQLRNFKTGKRKGQMQATAELLSEQDIQIVTNYFSQQTPGLIKPGISPESVAGAKTMFLQGDAKRGLIACASCHGQSALGSDGIPKLAGQHQSYLKTQLILFKNGQRNNDNDRVMRDIAEKLALSEITLLSKFLSEFAPVTNDGSVVSNKDGKVNYSERR